MIENGRGIQKEMLEILSWFDHWKSENEELEAARKASEFFFFFAANVEELELSGAWSSRIDPVLVHRAL